MNDIAWYWESTHRFHEASTASSSLFVFNLYFSRSGINMIEQCNLSLEEQAQTGYTFGHWVVAQLHLQKHSPLDGSYLVLTTVSVSLDHRQNAPNCEILMLSLCWNLHCLNHPEDQMHPQQNSQLCLINYFQEAPEKMGNKQFNLLINIFWTCILGFLSWSMKK